MNLHYADGGQPDSELEALAAAQYATKVGALVERLREMADRIERTPVRRDLDTLGYDFAAHAGEALHTLTWGLANADLGALSRRAAQVHDVRHGGGDA